MEYLGITPEEATQLKKLTKAADRALHKLADYKKILKERHNNIRRKESLERSILREKERRLQRHLIELEERIVHEFLAAGRESPTELAKILNRSVSVASQRIRWVTKAIERQKKIDQILSAREELWNR